MSLDFGKRLKEARERKGITQAALAKAASIGESTVSFYESGKREPNYETLIKLANILDTTPNYLLTGRQEWWEKDEPPADIELDGIAASIDGHKIIGVNSSLEEPLRRFVIAHELGHFVLHPEGNFFFVLRKTMLYGKLEYQANLFAVALCFGKKIAQHDDIKSVITGQVKDFYSIAKIL